MAQDGSGWLKFGVIGCLGLILIIVLSVGVTALVAWNKQGNEQLADRVLSPDYPSTTPDPLDASVMVEARGHVILDLGQGEFTLEPTRSGEPMRVEAVYDENSYVLEEELETREDSTWVYRVRFRRNTPGFVNLLRQVMGGHSPELHVFIPPDIPIILDLNVEEGGMEVELGGLWITDADIAYAKGGLSISVDEPLRQPMGRMVLRGSMGGFEARRLGNASPRELDIDCSMGGAEVDLRGQWLQDSDIRIDVSMGGAEIRVPDDVTLEGVPERDTRLRSDDPEVGRPTLRFTVASGMGGVEFSR